MYNPYYLIDKTILITGASSGIGRATAIECSKLGAKCIITGRDETRLQDTFNQLEGENHIQLVADLTNPEDVESLISQIPAIDGFVNNAGVALTKLINFVNQEDLYKVFSINTFAPMLLTKGLLKKKKINKGGSIVITSSIAAMVQTYGNAVYGMSKSAIMTFTRYCALEAASKNIRVNSIHPGMINTEMVSNSILTKEELDKDLNKYPLKRYGKPEEVAWMIIYLLSDATAWVTGSSFVIDGGFHLV